jgi:hypothetical protein
VVGCRLRGAVFRFQAITNPAQGLTMKHILYAASIVLLLVCGANIAMAFIGVPPLSGTR